jgi:ABC-type phosphate/phosphonate transport system substrate-binding protein
VAGAHRCSDIVGFSGAAGFAVEAPTGEIVRVGIVSSEDYGHRRTVWESIFAVVGQLHEPKLQFELAARTYGDVLHWLERGSVDVALLTPGVFAEYLRHYDAEGGGA